MSERPAGKGWGATELRDEGENQTFNVNVTVTSVNGNDVKFDMVETVDKNQVASVISAKLTQQVGKSPMR